MSRRFKNKYKHAAHGIFQILTWKLGLGNRDTHNSADEGLPAVVMPDFEKIVSPTPHDITVTWIGHASFLIQFGGISVLIDPIYASHCSPLPLPSLRRLQPPGIPFEKLPPIDAVLITHNHYDHLDAQVVRKLAHSSHFIVPEGLDKWMRKKGVQQVTPIPWWHQETILGELKITACPAQHFSARTPFDRNLSYWCGWMIRWRDQKIYHLGDSGYCPHFTEIARKLGPIDLALIPIGAYAPRQVMKPMHMSPEEAVQTHHDLQSRHSIACHWGTFRLTDEPTMEPARRLEECPKNHHGAFHTLPIGGSVTLPTP